MNNDTPDTETQKPPYSGKCYWDEICANPNSAIGKYMRENGFHPYYDQAKDCVYVSWDIETYIARQTGAPW